MAVFSYVALAFAWKPAAHHGLDNHVRRKVSMLRVVLQVLVNDVMHLTHGQLARRTDGDASHGIHDANHIPVSYALGEVIGALHSAEQLVAVEELRLSLCCKCRAQQNKLQLVVVLVIQI